MAVLAVATNGVFLVYTLVSAGRWFPPLDDAFIYIQYAERIATGHPFSYQAGDGFSTGATSPLYPFLLAPFALVVDPRNMPWVTFALGLLWKWLGCVLGGLVVLSITRHRAPAGLAVLLLSLHGAWTHGTLNGMETGLFAVALLAAAVAMVRPPGGTVLLAGGLAVAGLARPEAAMIPVALLAMSLWRASRMRWVRPALAMALLPVLIYLGLVFVYTGSLGTATSNSKLLSAHPYQSALTMLGRAGSELERSLRLQFDNQIGLPPVALPLIVAGAVMLWRRRRGTVLVLLTPMLVALFSVAPYLNDARYFHPFVPLLVVLWVIGAWAVVLAVRRVWAPTAWRVVVVASVLAVLPTFLGRARDFSQSAAEMWMMHGRAAKWLRDETPKDAVIGIHDAGVLTALSERRTFDFNGLTTPELFGIAGSVPGGIYETMVSPDEAMTPRLPFERRPTHLASFESWMPRELRGTMLARFPYPENRWGGGQALTIWEAAIPDTVLGLYPYPYHRAPGIVTDWMNHAELRSEQAHVYTPRQINRWQLGTISPLRRLPPIADSPWLITAGGRILSDRETFRMQFGAPNARLVLRLYSASRVRLGIRVGDHREKVWVAEEPDNFQIVEFPVPTVTVRGELEVEIEVLHGTGDSPDAVEIYDAWATASVGSSAFETLEASSRAPLEAGVLAMFDRMNTNRLPLDEKYQLFWHRGFRFEREPDTDQPVRRIIDHRMGLGIPVLEVGAEPRLYVRGILDEPDFVRTWGYRYTPEINGVKGEPIDVFRIHENEFILSLPRQAMRPGINYLQLHVERIFMPDWPGEQVTEEGYYPLLRLSEVHLRDMGWE